LTTAASELFGLDDARAMIEALREPYPHLVQSLHPQPYTLTTIAGLCRALLSERVPLRDFRSIAEALAELSSSGLEIPELVEAVRQRIGAQIVQAIVPLGMPLQAITFDPDLEQLLVQAVRIGGSAKWPFEPSLARRLTGALDGAIQPLTMAARSFAVITSPSCRAAVSRLLRAQVGEVPVLSFLEIPERLQVEVVAVVGGKTEAPALPPSHSIGD
jgi:flagellar biosynthesis protein FlhA